MKTYLFDFDGTLVDSMPTYGALMLRILDENGRIDVKRLDPICFDGVSNAYLRLGEKAGQAFSDGKKIK